MGSGTVSVMTEASYKPEPLAARFDVIDGRGAFLTSPGFLRIPNEPHPGWVTTLRISADGRSIGAVGASVETADPSEKLTSLDLRKVRVTELIREHLPQFVTDVRGLPLAAPSPDEFAEIRKRRGPLLSFVADRYNLAIALGLHPNKYIQDLTGAPRPTVSDWLRACRTLEKIDG